MVALQTRTDVSALTKRGFTLRNETGKPRLWYRMHRDSGIDRHKEGIVPDMAGAVKAECEDVIHTSNVLPFIRDMKNKVQGVLDDVTGLKKKRAEQMLNRDLEAAGRIFAIESLLKFTDHEDKPSWKKVVDGKSQLTLFGAALTWTCIEIAGMNLENEEVKRVAGAVVCLVFEEIIVPKQQDVR